MKTACQKEPGRPDARCAHVLATVLLFLLPGLILLMACSGGSSPKFKQYYSHGERLYRIHCSNCHQPDGSGLGRVYPPLDTSDFMRLHFNETICLMRHGISGELIVNTKQFNQEMPGNPALSDLEIAEIATYIYNSWSNERGLIEVKEVSDILASCQETD